MTRRLVVLLLAPALLLAAGTVGQPRSADLVHHLAKTERLLTEALDGLTPEQWSFSPGEGRWSVAQCAEHLVLSEDLIRQAAEKVMASPPATPDQKKAVLGNEKKIAKMLPDRSHKVQAPPPVQPKGGASLDQIVERFSASRAKTVSFVKSNGDELRNHVGDHPAFDQLDAYQWVLFLSAHVERHVAQINEVKAHPNYPR